MEHVIYIAFFIAFVVFVMLGTNLHHKRLKKIISIQDVSIKKLKDENFAYAAKLHDKNLHLTKVVAENASLKIRNNNLEDAEDKRLKEREEFNRKFQEAMKNSSPNVIENMPPTNTFWAEAIMVSGRRDRPDLFPPKEEKPPINEKLQAYYNRGKNNPKYKSKKRKPKNK